MFGALRKRKATSVEVLDEEQLAEVKQQKKHIARVGLNVAAKQEDGNMLMHPYIPSDASECYQFFIREFLRGDMQAADTRLNEGETGDRIKYAANVLFALTKPFGAEKTRTLYRGLNLTSSKVFDRDEKGRKVLPFNEEHHAYSYTDDPAVACTFAKAGRGKPYVVMCKPHPRRVLFHYSYLVKFATGFTADFAAFDINIDSPEISRGLTPADIFHLLQQREVLVRNGPSLVQIAVPLESVCNPSRRYVPMGEEAEQFYDEAMAEITKIPDPETPATPEYEQLQAQLRADRIKNFDKWAEEANELFADQWEEDDY